MSTNTGAPPPRSPVTGGIAIVEYDLDRNGRGDVPFRPVRLFSLFVANNPPSVVLMRSAFVDVLDAAERALPVLTPQTLVDASPLMERPSALKTNVASAFRRKDQAASQ